MPFPTPEQIAQLLGGLVDDAYTQTTGAVVNAITRPADSGRLNQRMTELRDEARRLAAAGEKLTPDNPVFAAMLGELQVALKNNSALVDAVSPDLQAKMSAAAGVINQSFAATQSPNFVWNAPNAEATAALANYVDSDAWRNELAQYQKNIADTVANIAIRGFVAGDSPTKVAEDLIASATNLPLSYAEQMMRSLQLTALRDSMVIQQVANADKIERIVRVAALDSRTCLSCVALHGTFLEVGDRVNDHRNGRCIGVPLLKGQAFSQSYVVDGQRIDVTSGEQWLNAHSDAGKRALMGPANFNAYRAGAVQLDDYVQLYRDPVFGEALAEASLKGILGDAAQAFYAR